jgi:hypothetical protein
MNWLIKFALGKVSGPILIYAILALFAANVLTGALLKSAWEKNAQAVLQCENQALRDANIKNAAVAAELSIIQAELVEVKKQKQVAGVEAEKKSAALLHAKDIEHAQALTDLEFAKYEITDDEYLCASERVPFGFRNGMRNAAAAYNANRNNPGTGIPPD